MSPSLLLAAVFLAPVLAGAWWIAGKLPRIVPRIAGFAGGCLYLGSIALLGYGYALRHLDRVQRTCTACGRTESIHSVAGVRLCCEELESGEHFRQRFAPALAAGHEHSWVAYLPWLPPHPSDISGWFRELPLIADRTHADEVFRKSSTFPAELEEQVWVGFSVSVDHRPEHESREEAFERWRTRDWPRFEAQR